MATSMKSDEGAANILTEKYLRHLATELGAEWESLATYLDFRKSEIDKIKLNRPGDVDSQIFDMLVQWRQKLGTIRRSHVDTLSESLKKVNRPALADQLEEMECEVSHSGTDLREPSQQQKPADSSTEMSFTYSDPNCSVNVKNLKITGKDNPIFVGTVKDTVFNFH